MYTESVWPLIDTSLKIILGALIAGCCLWIAYKRNQLFPKPQVGRRIQILEGISRDVGKINHLFSQYSSLVIESIRFGEQWPMVRREELIRVNHELVKEFKRMADAEAQLLMLGEKDLEKTLRLYGAKIAYFRKHVYVGRKDLPENEILRLKADILHLRSHFYDILSRKYDRLLAM